MTTNLKVSHISGRKVEYEANHKRTDGTITVLVSDIKGAMLKVYIDDELDSEQIM